jgi:hypothetical protein
MKTIPKEMSQIVDKQNVSTKKCKFLALFAVAALAALLCPSLVSAVSILGSAENFAVLAGTPSITNTGSTTITGDVGISPASSITGTGSITLNGAYYVDSDPVAITAKTNLTAAYTALNLMPATTTLVSNELGGLVLPSGVYAFQGNPATVLLTAGAGALTLDAQNNNNAFWVFQIPTALTTSVGSSVNVINFGSNGGNDDGLFWTVGSSASIFGSTSFEGNILALTSITLGNSATILNGRALAQNGDVTMDANTISNVCPIGGPGNGGPGYSGGLVFDTTDTTGTTIVPIGPSPGPSPVPEPSTMLLLGFGLAGLVAFRNRFTKA